jgi:hypothetical protein
MVIVSPSETLTTLPDKSYAGADQAISALDIGIEGFETGLPSVAVFKPQLDEMVR